MRANYRIVIAISVVVFVALFVMALRGIKREPPEPVFQNRRLSEWLLDYSQSRSNRAAAEAAIRAIGTNALPYLVSELQRTENADVGRAKKKVEERLKTRIVSGADRAYLALAGLEMLGTNAAPAIPELIELFRDAEPYYGGQDPAYQASRALKRIGPLATPALIAATTNGNEMIRVHSCFTLGELAATNGVPALIARLDDSSRMVRIRAAIALGTLHADEEKAVAALGRALDDADSAVRFSAALALGQFGTQASSAATKLQMALGRELKRPPGKPGKGGVFEEKTGGEVVGAICTALTQMGVSVAQPSSSQTESGRE